MDDLLKYYEEIEKKANSAAASVKRLVENTKNIGGSAGGKMALGFGALGVGYAATSMVGIAGSKDKNSAYKDVAREIKTAEAETKVFGFTLEKIGSKAEKTFKAAGSSIKSFGTDFRATATNATQMDQVIASMAGRTGALSKSITALAQVSKVAFGTMATVYLGASVAYEQFIDKSIKKSDELIKKQQEVATSFKSNMSFSQGVTTDQAKMGLAYSRTSTAAQGLFNQGIPGGRMGALGALQQGAEKGFSTNISSQLVQVSQQIAMAQGKALEPVLKDVVSKAFVSFIGKSETDKESILRRQQLVGGMNYLSYGPGVRDSVDDSFRRAGRGFSQAKSGMSGVGSVFNRLLAGPGYDYEDNPLYSKFFDKPGRGLKGWLSSTGGKITRGLAAPFVMAGDQAGRFGTAATGVLGSVMSGSKVGRVSDMGKELELLARGQNAGREADTTDTVIAGMSKEIEGTKALKKLNEMGSKSDEAEKKKTNALNKLKSLDEKSKHITDMSKEDKEKFYKELDEAKKEHAEAVKEIQEYQKAKTESAKYIKNASVKSDSELKQMEENRGQLEEKSAARRAIEGATNFVLPKALIPGLSFEQTQDLGTLSSEFEAESTQYRKSSKRAQEILAKKNAGGTLNRNEQEELDSLMSSMKKFASTWVTGADEKDVQAYQEETSKLAQMKGSGTRDDLVKEQQKKVDELKKKVDVSSIADDIQKKQQAAIAVTQDKFRGFSKAEDVADMQGQISSMLQSGIIDEETQKQVTGILGGGYDIDAIKKAFGDKDSGKIFDLFKGKVSMENIDKDVLSGDMSQLFQRGLRIDPSQMLEAQSTLQLKNREFQRKRTEMGREYQPQEKELQKGFMEYNVKELQQTGKFAQEEIKKVTDLLEQKDELSKERAQKEISLMEKKYQLAEATQKLEMKGIERQYDRKGLGIQIGTMAGKGMLGAGEANMLSGAANLQEEQFDKASPIVQNILSIRENMYKKELEFTTQYTEARMNIIKAHYDKSMMMERLKLEGGDRKIAPYVQGAQGMMSAFGAYNQGVSNKANIQDQMIGEARAIRGMGEQKMMMGYQMAGVEVPESIQKAMAIRGQQEQEADFYRQKAQQREADTNQLGQMGDVWSKIGSKGKGYGDFAKTESGRGMLQSMLLQSQGALARTKGIDVTPMLQDLSGKQFEHEFEKMNLNLSEREKLSEMNQKQIGVMEQAIGGAEGQKKTDLSIALGGQYKQAAEYYSSIGESDKAKEMSDKYIKTQEMVPAQLQSIKDEGMRQAVNELQKQTALLEKIAGVKSGDIKSGGGKGGDGKGLVPPGAIDLGKIPVGGEGVPGGVGSGIPGGSDMTKPLAAGVADTSPISGGINVVPSIKEGSDPEIGSYYGQKEEQKKAEEEFIKRAKSTGNNLSGAQRDLDNINVDFRAGIETGLDSITSEMSEIKKRRTEYGDGRSGDSIRMKELKEKKINFEFMKSEYGVPGGKKGIESEKERYKKTQEESNSQSTDSPKQTEDSVKKFYDAVQRFADARHTVVIKKDGNVSNHQIEYGRG